MFENINISQSQVIVLVSIFMVFGGAYWVAKSLISTLFFWIKLRLLKWVLGALGIGAFSYFEFFK